MRTPKQVKTIASQLEVLEELRDQLENTVDYINSVLHKGKEWIDETNNESFVKINQFLVTETSECLRRCASITDDEDMDIGKSIAEPVDRNTTLNEYNTKDQDDKEIVQKTHKLETLVTTQAKDMKLLKHQVKKLVKQNERRSKLQAETEQSFHFKFEAVMRELEAASNFMSHLQSQNESLSSQVIETFKLGNTPEVTDRLHSVELSITEHNTKLEELLLQERLTENSILIKVKEFLAQSGTFNDQTKWVKSYFPKLTNDVKHINESYGQVQKSLKVQEENLRSLEKRFEDSEKLKAKQLQDLETNSEPKYESANALKSQSESITANYKQINTDFKQLCLKFDKQTKETTDRLFQLSATNISTAAHIKEQIKKFSVIESKLATIDKKNNDVSSQVVQLLSRILHLESKETHEAFCVELGENLEIDVRKDQVFPFFNQRINLASSQSKNFDTNTGIFKAPCNGLYLVCLKLETLNDMKVIFNVCRKDKKNEDLAAFSKCMSKDIIGLDIVALDLNKDDQVYVRSNDNYFGLQLGANSSFSCILLSKF
ncbi:synaptonemal complex protein 1 [Biomphalaria pfeifferi]|uniref:Synaptonemal complex protein 1 n=1 Tax=Biomphalaria pfeifferi TaxID=112525 RepID=A0AAD8BQM4_BIOPF|nr:synaptonemal complex protein 1 [Biomphalaria pfeifferi]